MVSRGIWDKYLELCFKIAPKYHEPLRRVIFGTILKYYKRYLSQIPRRNHCIICLYYKAEKCSLFLTLTRVIIDPRPKITLK